MSLQPLNQQQVELNVSLNQIHAWNSNREHEGSNHWPRLCIVEAYEDNENNIKKLEIAIADTKAEIVKIEKRLHQFDIQTN